MKTKLAFLTNYNIHNQEYAIKPADKGVTIVIWSTTDYEKEALSQVDDNKYYEKNTGPTRHDNLSTNQHNHQLCQGSLQIWRH